MNSPFITSAPEICSGKPHVTGTRLTVEFLQGLRTTGWTRDEILGTYPYLKLEELDAALVYSK